jgi:hypothetical protein
MKRIYEGFIVIFALLSTACVSMPPANDYLELRIFDLCSVLILPLSINLLKSSRPLG